MLRRSGWLALGCCLCSGFDLNETIRDNHEETRSVALAVKIVRSAALTIQGSQRWLVGRATITIGVATAGGESMGRSDEPR